MSWLNGKEMGKHLKALMDSVKGPSVEISKKTIERVIELLKEAS